MAYDQQKIRLLEIGPGMRPAVSRPGTIFSGNAVYYSVDALADEEARRISSEDNIVAGRMDALGFLDNSFDIVIMRSVFGEYTLPRIKNEDKDVRGLFCQVDFTSIVYRGFQELYRTIKPNGRLIVAEEDTPMTSLELDRHLTNAGFEDITITPYSRELFTDSFRPGDRTYAPKFGKFVHPDPKWIQIRSEFWDSQTDWTFHGWFIDSAARYYPTASYLLSAKKPQGKD